jgi:hypothetical protein
MAPKTDLSGGWLFVVAEFTTKATADATYR